MLRLTRKRSFRIRNILAFAVCFALAAFVAGISHAGDIRLGGGGGEYVVPTKSLLASRFRTVVRQRYDYSCGSAAVATLLRYHYGQDVTEKEVLDSMFAHGDQPKIQKEGFSMLDMKTYLEAVGYHAEGFRESLDKLTQVGIPAIVLMNKRGYLHFVVVKGVSKDRVSVGDPTLGLRIYDRDDFEKMWNGILFVVLDDKKFARASFNTRSEWTSHGNPHFRGMLDRGELGNLTMDISLTPGYY